MKRDIKNYVTIVTSSYSLLTLLKATGVYILYMYVFKNENGFMIITKKHILKKNCINLGKIWNIFCYNSFYFPINNHKIK